MKMITREIRVNAPVERVFEFLADPHHLPEIWPNVVQVENVKKSKTSDGFNFGWDYKMAGTQFEGKCETIEHVPYERLAVKSNKGLDSTILWRFQPAGQQTQVTFRFEYQIPATLLKTIKEPILVQENEHEVDAMLQNVKTRLELEPAYA